MPLQPQSLNINFAQGLDTKTDPFQVPMGKFLTLENTIFSKIGRLQKRNGYGSLSTLPDDTSSYITTFNGNLTAVGTALQAYSQSNEGWVDKGSFQPVSLNTLPLIRSSTNQSQADSAAAPSGLVCTVFTDNVPVGGSLVQEYKYVVADSVTGQNIVAPIAIPSGAGMITTAARVFLLGNWFVIMITNTISGTAHLQYFAVNINDPSINSGTPINLSSIYSPTSTLNFDGFVANNSLYFAWEGDNAVHFSSLSHVLIQQRTATFAGYAATIMSVSADVTGTTPVIYAAFYDSVSQTGYVLAINQVMATVLAPTEIITATPVANITSSAQNGILTVFYQVINTYAYDTSIRTDYINTVTVTQAGVVGSTSVVERSVGLASKAFLLNGTSYFLTVYGSEFQPGYYLINQFGNIVAKLAYQNSGPYLITGLPQVTLTNNVVQLPYLYKDLIEAVNKSMNAPSVAGVYSQTGINLVSFTIGISNLTSSEIGQNLHLTGGFLWMYDGYSPVEHGFFVYPDYVEATTSTAGGFLSAQEYFYQVTYEWTDNQGNVHRSAPSIPISVTSTGSTSSNTINIPTLRLTYKIANPLVIVIYRWSTAQETFYQVTSVEVPVLNDPTIDYITYVDTQSDADILGNNILYTTGGVIENISAPASSVMTLFNNRLFLVDAEDQNLLWYSKIVIEDTPVEMSDLLTIYVAPTTSAQGSTGPTLAASALDDKIILFKKDAIYYINGSGPDSTGANSQYSDAIFVTSTVGCANQQSIVFIPTGLMFQSDKGIWLLGRDLSTNYIGAPVEAFNGYKVTSAVNVPGTDQVRFTLSNGTSLMYDYFFQQWSTFVGVPAISSTLYEGLHTYLNSYGQVLQETPGIYIDGSNPVLLSFTTNWINLAGLQGFERFYEMLILGTYVSPFKLNVQISYNYNDNAQQGTIVTPNQFNPAWGGDPLWGSAPYYGGSSSKFLARVFPQTQKVESFQIQISEVFDESFLAEGGIAGGGVQLSGLELKVGAKKGYRTSRASQSFG